jgi:signal transduction histidine kinase
MTLDRGNLTLMLAEEWRTYELLVPGVTSLPREWIDAEIEVDGFGYPFYNSRNQPTSFRFHCPSRDRIRVITPGVGKLFERPLISIAEASRQNFDWKQRLKIVGTVTAHQPVDVLFIDDGTGPMQVNLLAPLAKYEGILGLDHDAQVWLQPGERVEVIGMRRNYSSLTPTLAHAEFRRVGNAPPIPAQPVTIEDLKAGRFSGRVVSIAARLRDQRVWSVGNVQHQLLVLEAGNQIFQAAWEGETPATWDLKPRSWLRLTGVNDVTQGQFKGAFLFRLLLRSPSDVVAALPPPFWERPEIRRIAVGAGAVGLLAAAWILFQGWQMRRLEHRVAARTSDLRTANEQLQEEVTARERAETEVQRALAQEKQLSELKSRFVSMVSHEFRTPLGIITSSAEILDAYLERLSSEERKSNIRDITDATRHMSRMMEEVLLLGRVEAGRMTCRPAPLDLTVLGQRLVDEVSSATANRCPIQFTGAPGLPEARADEALLRHILTNLLNNAVKYSPPGSPVEFRIEARNHLALFTVADHGIGIPEADARLLFQAFHRGRNVGDTPGTGLGMTIVKRCVELHGGKIAFETHEGRGTAFIVALPLFDSPASGNGEATAQFIRAAAAGRELTFIL